MEELLYMLARSINQKEYSTIDCPLILGAGHPQLKILKYLLLAFIILLGGFWVTALLYLTEPLISVIPKL